MARQKNPSGKTSGSNGKGSSKGRTPEQHEAARRAAKRKQNANARANAASKEKSGGTFIDGLYEDRQKAHQERDQRMLERQETQRLNFQIDQANLALEHRAITDLKAGTIADKMARLVIELFPVSKPYPGPNGPVSKTSAAVENAMLAMTPDELARPKAINFGISAARVALNSAYRQLSKRSVAV